ncbi:MAG: RluA family pseudouridine synthase [Bacteroidaceae bacterium]|nr:RluA family pseudouridine synthase [Bacteroidaceae bacterium]
MSSQDYYNRKLANQYTDYVVKEPCELLQFLMTYVPGNTRTKAKQLLSQKMVFVDKVITTQFNTPLKAGQLVQIAKRGNLHQFRNKFVKILYEDAFLLVIEKKEGIITNTMPGGKENSVKRILDEYVKRKSRSISVHTVHRLDRVTSGLLIFAKRRDVQQMFTEHWHDIVKDRRYVAVVQGQMEKDSGTVESWLTDNKMFVTFSTNYDNGGKYAITHYRTLKRSEEYSLVELKLETGRKNQIRVHMQDLQHPVVGDLKYGSDVDPIGRVCLHAYRIEFVHPNTRELLSFETPIPQAFQSIMKNA